MLVQVWLHFLMFPVPMYYYCVAYWSLVHIVTCFPGLSLPVKPSWRATIYIGVYGTRHVVVGGVY